jgi:hypothetical protein
MTEYQQLFLIVFWFAVAVIVTAVLWGMKK